MNDLFKSAFHIQRIERKFNNTTLTFRRLPVRSLMECEAFLRELGKHIANLQMPSMHKTSDVKYEGGKLQSHHSEVIDVDDQIKLRNRRGEAIQGIISALVSGPQLSTIGKLLLISMEQPHKQPDIDEFLNAVDIIDLFELLDAFLEAHSSGNRGALPKMIRLIREEMTRRINEMVEDMEARNADLETLDNEPLSEPAPAQATERAAEAPAAGQVQPTVVVGTAPPAVPAPSETPGVS